ncbi:MAG: hypothetical protein R6U41_06885 [Desulfosalsimonas sp.]|uniref:hypothetical protein n=1 Tax=Desulfosalsimonas sp. TaxID=3073848 RepID=UPI0039705CB1
MKHKGILSILSLIGVLLISGMLLAGSAAAEEASESGLDWKAGLGYQGMWVGGFLNGISARTWIEDKYGVEANYFYGDVETRTFDVDQSDTSDADLYIFELKAMYAPVVREYSRFYVGAVVSRGSFDLKNTGYFFGRDFDDKIWGYGLFIGSEWHFQEFPEIGFNFDVGYKAYRYDDRYTDPDDGDYFKMDLDLEGIDATVGIHYYF